MIKKTIVLCLAVLATAGAAFAQSSGGGDEGLPAPEFEFALQKAASGSAAAGSALLDMFLENMRLMAVKGTPEDVEARLQKMRAAADFARQDKAVDAVFFSRFNRLLAITKLVATPDTSGILGPFIDRMLGEFVEDMLGHSGFRDEGGKGPKAINYVAQALSEEVINLQLYLDTLGRRQALKAGIDARMTAPAPK